MKKKHPKDYPTLHLRVPGELIPRIDALADRDNRTRSGWIVHKLIAAVEQDEQTIGPAAVILPKSDLAMLKSFDKMQADAVAALPKV